KRGQLSRRAIGVEPPEGEPGSNRPGIIVPEREGQKSGGRREGGRGEWISIPRGQDVPPTGCRGSPSGIRSNPAFAATCLPRCDGRRRVPCPAPHASEPGPSVCDSHPVDCSPSPLSCFDSEPV